MPKLNAVLMVVLTAAVIAATGFIVLGNRPDARAEAAERHSRLFRKLADADPDLRRDAEAEIRALGPKGTTLLQEASKSSDKTLADRAAKLLRELQPPAPVPPTRVESVQVREVAPETFGFQIECADGSFKRGEALRFYVRLVNSTPNTVVLYQGVGPRRYAGFAVFEVTDPDGLVSLLPPEPETLPQGGINPMPVADGKTFDLYAGQADGRTSLRIPAEKPGSYKVRFVWDATEGSAYRKIYDPTCAGGQPLPPQRLGSNTLVLHLGD